MPPLPSPLRAALGLAAVVLDEARTLPDKAIELPMLAVSKTLQLSLRAQHGYAALTARGDELLAARSVSDEAPSWATFDAVPNGSDARPTPAPRAEAPPVEPAPGRPAKTVRASRTRAPSAFDSVADE